MDYVGTLNEAFMNEDLYIPNSELVYLSDDDKITATLCNKLLYQSSESYGILDRKHTKEQENLVKRAYFDNLELDVLQDNTRRDKVLNELCRRLDKFITKTDKKYSSTKGQELMKDLVKTIQKHPKNYLAYLDTSLVSDVKVFDSISSINRTFKYFDELYSKIGVQMPKLRPVMDKYLENPIVNYFLRETKGINLDSRREIDENEIKKVKENQTDITMEM